MTPLGKCLVFHYKYQSEMCRLYWSKPKSKDIADLEVGKTGDLETTKMVAAVGEKCRQDVCDFLTECGNVIEAHFDLVGNSDGDGADDKKWTISYGVWAKRRNRPQSWRMKVGVDLPLRVAEIIPWVWGRKKDEFEDCVIHAFEGVKLIRHDEIQMKPGHVALARIPIQPPQDGFDLDRDLLLQQVKKAFSIFDRPKFDGIYAQA